ncbi:ABC transporter ATP-binding protein [Epidermidibacterium keratini]|uniref:ABC transporter ATP-binding protein n=1 Tax=Epidermidibacterium keratini TaxID=1891644 RepID=UPI001CEFB0F6|nr:ABC transporter ATP-binding protein [Epidermidibacterium keratini]
MSLTSAPRRAVRSDDPTTPLAPEVAAPALSVEFRDATRSFGTRTVLSGIDHHVAPGTITAILGPSGSGKSTLLRLAAGLDQPSSGSVLIDDRQVAAYDDRCAVAFQEARLLPWRSVRSNIELGLPRKGNPDVVDRLLELVGLEEFASHRPREISGGMAQRVSLARALARRPGVLLLDEPFGALDALTRIKMQSLLLDLHRAAPATVVMVTHDVSEAITLADTILVLGNEGSGPSQLIRTAYVDEQLRSDPVAVDALHSELLACLGVREP